MVPGGNAYLVPAGGAYVARFFVGVCVPLAPLRPPPSSHVTLSIASSEASLRR